MSTSSRQHDAICATVVKTAAWLGMPVMFRGQEPNYEEGGPA